MRIFTLFPILILFVSVSVAKQVSGQDHVLRYCIDPERMPFGAIRNGEHVGISRDYVELISEAMDTRFQLVITSSWTETLDSIVAEKCDLIPFIEPLEKRQESISFSTPYFNSPNVLVTRGYEIVSGLAKITDQLVGVVRNSPHADYLARYYPDIHVVLVENEAAGLEQLANGKLDVMLAALLSASEFIQRHENNQLSITGFTEMYDSVSVGVSKKYEHLLPQISAVLASIPESSKVDIYKRWDRSLPITTQNGGWLGIFSIIAVVVIISGIWYRHTKNRFNLTIKGKEKEIERLQSELIDKNRTVEFLSTHDELTGLHNRNYMVQKVDEEMSRYRRFNLPTTMLLIHVTNINHITQGMGQSRADEIMRRLAEITLKMARDVDTAARWTSEEILILCPQTSVMSAQILAERILTEIELQSLQLFEGTRVCIGAAAMKEGDTFVDWLDRAQLAMLKAKKHPNHAFESAPL